MGNVLSDGDVYDDEYLVRGVFVGDDISKADEVFDGDSKFSKALMAAAVVNSLVEGCADDAGTADEVSGG
ncbi:hypothetical protein, partial [Endozoicomonas sp. ONNA1]